MNYNIKVWRNQPDMFTPTIDEDVTDSKLVEWLGIMIANIQAETTDPLVQRIEISKNKIITNPDEYMEKMVS